MKYGPALADINFSNGKLSVTSFPDKIKFTESIPIDIKTIKQFSQFQERLTTYYTSDI